MSDGLGSVKKGHAHYLFFFGAPFVLSITTIAVYFDSLWYGFIFDDLPTIVNCIHPSSIDFKNSLFSNSRWVSYLLNQLTYAYWGMHPFAYRAVNLLVHVFTGILVFILLVRLFRCATKSVFLHEHSWFIATISSMLFLLHPVQTQTVTYITQMRFEGFVTFFIMAVLTTFVFAATTKNRFLKYMLYGVSFVLSAFATGTKEIIIVLPALVILVDWFFIAQAEWIKLKPRVLIYAVYACVVWGLFLKYGLLKPDVVKVLVTHPLHCNSGNVLTAHAHELIDIVSFALSQFKVLMHYITIFFWPVNLSFDYDVKLVRHIADADFWAPALGILAFLGMLVLWYRSWSTRVLTFGGLWFFIVMLPRTSIVPSTELMCDYKTFPASLGMMVIIAYCIAYFTVHLVRAWPMVNALLHVRGALIAVQCCGCLLLAWASNDRTEVWSSEVVFWKDALEKSSKARVLNHYAASLLHDGEIGCAIEHFNKAIEKDDWYADPHLNLGTIYQAQNKIDQALHHFNRAVEIGQGHRELDNKD